MPKIGRLVKQPNRQLLLSQVKWCSSYLCKLLGLMFRRALKPGEGLLMVEPRASRVATSIHMLFMAFPIAAIWMDGDLRVIDKVMAKPWRLAYVPIKAARYTLECSPHILKSVEIGDQLSFES